MKMTPTLKKYALRLVVALLTQQSSTLLAQGTAFTYNGRLNDSGGPANGFYDVRFVLFDANGAGTQQGNALTNIATSVSNGLFNVTLDFGAGVFTGADRWLEIGVRTNGGAVFATLNPRQKITATPYAITAGNLTGSVFGSQLNGTISSNNIANGSISGPMLANGSVTAASLASGAVTTSNLADGAVNLGKLSTSVTGSISATLSHASCCFQQFGSSVAAVGTDMVVAGAPWDVSTFTNQTGAAYLFNAAGLLLTVFTNPTPANYEQFGRGVAGFGPDKVLIGVPYDLTAAGGSACIFGTNGLLIKTITNPAPVAFGAFGLSLAELGGDRLVIGSSGAAYLFRTNGTLLTTFTNPSPAGGFGLSVAVLGANGVLIGAYDNTIGGTTSGAAYLFSTNGTLLTTITNPTPADGDQFGWSVALVSPDKVLIGAPMDDTATTNAGAAYVFSTNGTLLATLVNPTARVDAHFGYSVAASGYDKLYIGARSSSFFDAVYVFGTNGTLLTTLTAAGISDFGYATAGLGPDKVVVGAPSFQSFSGVAYLYSLSSPFVPGLVSQGVVEGSITGVSVADNAITSAKISSLDAAKITSGILGDARLSANVALLDRNPQTFSGGINNFNGRVGIYNATPAAELDVNGTVKATALIGQLSASQLTGTIPQAQLPGSLVTNNASGLTLSGWFAGSFNGNGGGLTNLSASQLTGTIASNNIGNGSITATMLANGSVTAASLATASVTSASLAPESVTSVSLADGSVGLAKLALASNWQATIVTNPTPANSDFFSFSIAGLGPDTVAIAAIRDNTGATNAGAVYLYNTNGLLLVTITNPAPATADEFGSALAAIGYDKILVGVPSNNTGANDAGAAYLFGASGALSMTFTNPTPVASENFGYSVAGVGLDRLLIGCPHHIAGGLDRGAAYFFGTNGTLLTSITNPIATSGDQFGWAVAGVGPDKLVISAPYNGTGAANAGVAYLYATNGIIITTITNPAPAAQDFFGLSLAAVGTDKLLIGTPYDDTGATDAGVAYLFSTNGALLVTFTNPTPAINDQFGYTVSAVGPDKVLIGAPYDDTGALDTGAAYLFSTAGSLLNTYTNPASVSGDSFGKCVAGVGADKPVIGAVNSDTGATDAGVAYLFKYATTSYFPGLLSQGVVDGSITSASLANDAVDSSKIADGAVGTVDLADNAVTSAKINSVDASKITSGTLSDARLSANVALLSGANVFTAANRFSSAVTLTNAANQLAGTFIGNGSGLTNLTMPTIANYVHSYDTSTQAVAVANTFQDITNGINGQLSGWIHVAGTTSFTNTQSGLYLVHYEAEAMTTTSAASTISLRVVANGTEIPGSQATAFVNTANQVTPISRSFIASFSSGDTLKFQLAGTVTNDRLVSNTGAGTTRPSFSCTIVRIQ